MYFPLNPSIHSTIRRLLFVVIVLPWFSVLATEQAQPEEENWTDSLFAAVTLGGGFYQQQSLSSNLEVGERYEDYLFLNIEFFAQWKGFFVELPGRSQEKVDGQYSGNAIGYNLYNSKHWSYDFYAVRSSGGITRRYANTEETLNIDRVSDYRLGFRATGYYDNLLAQFIITPYSLRDEIGGVEASASIRQNWQYRNWNFYNSIGLKYRSSSIQDYYYGVDDPLSTQFAELVADDPNADNIASFFSPYEADAGVGIHGEVGFEYPISEHLVFGGFFQYAVAPEQVKDSPLFIGDKFGHSFGLSLTYVF